MNKLSLITTGLLTSALVACGGDSGGGSGTDIVISESLKGAESAPELTSVTSGSVSLNSRVTGFLVEDGSVDWTFSHSEDTDVLLVLNSDADDFDLSVSGNTVFESSEGATSFEVILFDAEAGLNYNLEVSSFWGDGNYQLDVTVPNRETVGLDTDEFLVVYEADVLGDCDGYVEDYEYRYFAIVNWADGYTLKEGEKNSFDQADGNTVVVKYSESESDGSASYKLSGQTTFTVNTETGSITGTDVWSDEYNDEDYSESCSYTETLTGQIVL